MWTGIPPLDDLFDGKEQHSTQTFLRGRLHWSASLDLMGLEIGSQEDQRRGKRYLIDKLLFLAFISLFISALLWATIPPHDYVDKKII